MDGRQAARVSRKHRLDHVERLAAPHFADHDSIGPHPQRVANEIANGHLALPLHVGRSRLEADDVGLLESKLGGILDRFDALLFVLPLVLPLLLVALLLSPPRLPKLMLTVEPPVSGTPHRLSDVGVVLGAGCTLML